MPQRTIQSYFFYLGVIAMNIPFFTHCAFLDTKNYRSHSSVLLRETWEYLLCIDGSGFVLKHQRMAICSINQLWNSTQLTSFSYISVSFARLMISWRLQNVFFRFHSKPLVRNLLTFLVKDCLFCWSRAWMEHLT